MIPGEEIRIIGFDPARFWYVKREKNLTTFVTEDGKIYTCHSGFVYSIPEYQKHLDMIATYLGKT